jgi:hypothetical protein
MSPGMAAARVVKRALKVMAKRTLKTKQMASLFIFSSPWCKKVHLSC